MQEACFLHHHGLTFLPTYVTMQGMPGSSPPLIGAIYRFLSTPSSGASLCVGKDMLIQEEKVKTSQENLHNASVQLSVSRNFISPLLIESTVPSETA